MKDDDCKNPSESTQALPISGKAAADLCDQVTVCRDFLCVEVRKTRKHALKSHTYIFRRVPHQEREKLLYRLARNIWMMFNFSQNNNECK